MPHLLLAELVEEVAKLRLYLAGHGRVDSGHLMVMMTMVMMTMVMMMMMMMIITMLMMMMIMMMTILMMMIWVVMACRWRAPGLARPPPRSRSCPG